VIKKELDFFKPKPLFEKIELRPMLGAQNFFADLSKPMLEMLLG